MRLEVGADRERARDGGVGEVRSHLVRGWGEGEGEGEGWG